MTSERAKSELLDPSHASTRAPISPQKPPDREAPPRYVPIADRTAPIDPDLWIVRKTFVFGGLTYSRGEPVPKMTSRQAEVLRADGRVALRSDIGTAETRFVHTPETVTDYLRGNDLTVLQRVRQHPPSIAQLEEMVERAARGRSQIFREALEAILLLRRPAESGT